MSLHESPWVSMSHHEPPWVTMSLHETPSYIIFSNFLQNALQAGLIVENLGVIILLWIIWIILMLQTTANQLTKERTWQKSEHRKCLNSYRNLSEIKIVNIGSKFAYKLNESSYKMFGWLLNHLFNHRSDLERLKPNIRLTLEDIFNPDSELKYNHINKNNLWLGGAFHPKVHQIKFYLTKWLWQCICDCVGSEMI